MTFDSRRILALPASLALLVAACSAEPGDSGRGGNGGGGSGSLSWPAEALATIDGAGSPGVAVTDVGTILLALDREGRAEIIVDPAGEAEVVDLGQGTGPHIAASPDEGDAVVLFTRGEKTLCAWLSDGALAAPAFELIDDQDDWGYSRTERGISLYWSGAGPVAFLHSHLRSISGAVQQDARADFILMPVPTPERGSVSLPSLGMRLATNPGYHFISHGESPTVFDLYDHPISSPEEPMVLGAKSRAMRNEDEEPQLQWILARTYPGNESVWGDWYGPVETGTAAMPVVESASWVEVHRLGPTSGVVTWHAPSGSLAFDVFMTSMTINDEGLPLLGESYVNVSETFGMTDHSEHPVVRPTGDGRFWITWREAAFGPRVALYDEELNRLGVAAPSVNLEQSQSAPVAATVVMPGGDLLLAAQVEPGEGSRQVRLWRIELPH